MIIISPAELRTEIILMVQMKSVDRCALSHFKYQCHSLSSAPTLPDSSESSAGVALLMTL